MFGALSLDFLNFFPIILFVLEIKNHHSSDASVLHRDQIGHDDPEILGTIFCNPLIYL